MKKNGNETNHFAKTKAIHYGDHGYSGGNRNTISNPTKVIIENIGSKR